MKLSFLEKFIALTIAIFLITGPSGILFASKASAQTPGTAVGKAVADGVACFLAVKLEMFAQGLASKFIKTGEGHGNMGLYPEAVPVTDLSAPGEISKIETSNAISLAKNCVRDTVVKELLDWIVDETVNWIQNGGTPRFVTDWKTFSKDAWNVGVGEIISQTNAAWLCKPFRLQMKMAIQSAPSQYKESITCTLDDIVNNIDDFYRNFQRGGWLGYSALWEPQNNFFGASLQAVYAAKIKGEEKQKAAEQEALAGKGFLSVKKCVKVNETDYADCLEDDVFCPPGTDFEECKKECEKMACEKEEIITPGDTVGALAAKTMTSDIEWANNVKSWTAALTNAVINRLTEEGIGLMKGSKAPRSTGYGDYNVYGNYDVNLENKRKQLDQIKKDYQNFIDYFNTVITTEQKTISYLKESIELLTEMKNHNCFQINDESVAVQEKEIARLNDEINTYQNFITETNVELDKVKNISPDIRDAEIIRTNNDLNEFIEKHMSFVSEVNSGLEKIKKDAQSELETKQKEASENRERLSLCLSR